MAETAVSPPAGLDRGTEEAGVYHEAALNGAWTGSRLAMGGLSFLLGAFVFAYFYLRSVNSSGRWEGSGYHPPSMVMGTVIMLLMLASAGVQYGALQRIRAGDKTLWQIGGLSALALGLGAVALQASLSAFTVVWNCLAVVAVVFWVLFYVI